MDDRGLRSLNALVRLRKIETDEARRALADALASETALVEQDETLRLAMRDAQAVAGDFDRERFSAFMARMRQERARLQDSLRAAEARTAAARTMLAQRRLAEKAAAEGRAKALAAREQDAARRDQVMLEDAARALQRSGA